MNHYSQTTVLSSIHQIDENSTNNYQSNNTSIVIDPEEEEKDLRKRIIKNVNTSIIWREYQLYEVKNALEHNRKIELREIFNKQRNGTNKMTFTEEFNKLIESKDTKFILKCVHCGDEFTFYKSSKTSSTAITHIKEKHGEKYKICQHQVKRPYSKINIDDKYIQKGHILLVSIILTQQLPYHIAVNEFFIDSVEHLQNQNAKYSVAKEFSTLYRNL